MEWGCCCLFEAIRFLDARCSQIFHTVPLIHQVVTRYMNKHYIWSSCKSQFQLFLPPAFFILTSLTGTFTCTFVDTLLHIHSPISSKTPRKLRHFSTWGGDDVKVMWQWMTVSYYVLWATMYCCVSESEGALQENRKVKNGRGGNKIQVFQWAFRILFSGPFDCCVCIHRFSLERWDSWTQHSREKGEINILQMLRWRLMEEVVSGEVLH